VDKVGWQLWQLLIGLVLAASRKLPSIQQPAWQLPALHTRPVPQLPPLGTWVHAEVEVPGWQVWQLFPGCAAPLA
jgi:hypothetical protein